MNSEDDERESEQSLLRASGTHSHPRHVSHPLYHFEHIDNLSTVIIPPFHFPQKKKKEKRNREENPLHLKRYPVSWIHRWAAWLRFLSSGWLSSLKGDYKKRGDQVHRWRKEGKHRTSRAMNTPLAGIRPRITYVHGGPWRRLSAGTNRIFPYTS